MVTLHLCDYGSGNVHNVERALARVGAHVIRCTRPEELLGAKAIVIPGVGAFGECIASLRAKGFEGPIQELARSGAWVLGICVGMQILSTYSEEFGLHQGLGIVPGAVQLIPGVTPSGEKLKRPHIGWSPLFSDTRDWSDTPLRNLQKESSVYFVHSYHFVPDDPNDVLAYARYGGCPIVAAVSRKRVLGVQFHPEKSGYAGLNILTSFVKQVEADAT